MSTALVSILAVLGLLIVGGGPVALAQEATGIELTPSRIEQDLTSRSFSYDYSIFNHDDEQRAVDLELAALGHDLDGTPLFPPLETDSVTVSSHRVEIPPGASATVTVSGRIPAGQAGFYAGVVAEARPTDSGAGDGVGVRTRVAGLMLIRGPRPWDETLVVEDVQIVKTEGGAEARVVLGNQGDVHVAPIGTVRVERGGNVLASVALRPENIIPGYARRFAGDLAGADLGEGPVSVIVDLQQPELTYETIVASVGGIPDFAISSVRAARDEAATPVVEVAVENTGEQAIAEGTGLLTLTDGPGGLSTQPVTAPSAAMAPGESQLMVFPLDAELPVGPWRAVISVSAAGIERAAEATITFPEESGTTSETVVATPIHRDRAFLVPLAVGLLILALFLVFLVWWLKRRREDEDRDGVDEGAGRDYVTAVAEE